MEHATVKEHIDIDTPAAEIFDFILDTRKTPLVFPDLVEITNASDYPLKQGSTFDFIFQMSGVMLKGTWHALRVDSPHRYEGKTTGDVESTWHYNFESHGHSTTVSLEIDYGIPKNVSEKMKMMALVAINRRVAQTYLQNLKTILEVE